MTAETDRPETPRYVPAAGRAGLIRLYDPVMALTMREARWRADLADRVLAVLPPAGRAVDVGAGTGTFALALAAARPDAEVIAVDGDDEALAIAAAKPGAAAVDWRRGLAAELPLEDAGADALTMSLLLHHLSPAARRAALTEAFRVLRPGGRLHVADWGTPQGAVPRLGFMLLRCLDGFANTRDHAVGRLPAFIVEAGFSAVGNRRRVPTTWGSLELLSGRRPEST